MSRKAGWSDSGGGGYVGVLDRTGGRLWDDLAMLCGISTVCGRVIVVGTVRLACDKLLDKLDGRRGDADRARVVEVL